MFGQNNSDPNQQDAANQNPMLANSAPPAGFFNNQPPAGAPPQNDQGFPASPPQQDPNAPTAQPDGMGAPMIMDDNPTDFAAPSTPEDASAEATAPASDMPAPGAGGNDLLNMKQEALQQLTPLVQHLDQSPEDKFRTVMMMIQASDDHTKLGEAFDLAKQIGDDKARAQALLDVINEINYFTQNNAS